MTSTNGADYRSQLVFDANVLIGFLDSTDAHHANTLSILAEFVHVGFVASALTVAEALVYPTIAGVQDRAHAALDDIGLSVVPLGEHDVLELARVRAQYRVRMPDAVALHAAITTHATLATFDHELADAARRAGLAVATR